MKQRSSTKQNVRSIAAALVAAALATGSSGCTTMAAAPKPIEVKVVVVTMFEIGADTGDTAGEFQLWRERQKLDERLPFAHHHDLYFNPSTGVLGMVTGMGTANSASATMELGMDPRFDLSHAYWIVAGTAGVDPADASIGSAAVGEYLVDGDLAHEIDLAKCRPDWPTATSRGTRKPYDPRNPTPTAARKIFHLNGALTSWASGSRTCTLDDSPELKKSAGVHPDSQYPAPALLCSKATTSRP